MSPQPVATQATNDSASDPDDEPLRRRFMLAAIRLEQPTDPAHLNDCDLFDLFAMLGDPDFTVWKQSVAAWERWQDRLAAAGAPLPPAAPAPVGEPLSHREFDAQLRRQRA